VAYAAGFGSLRRFNGQIRRTYSRTPTQLRRLARRSAATGRDAYRFRLAYRPPYDWAGVLAFLRARATPAVEPVDGARSPRTTAIDGRHGLIEVTRVADSNALDVEVRLSDPRALLSIVERVRRMFDLGADPSVIGDHLRTDPLLRPLLLEHPGVR